MTQVTDPMILTNLEEALLELYFTRIEDAHLINARSLLSASIRALKEKQNVSQSAP